jgi:hypothetical protein
MRRWKWLVALGVGLIALAALLLLVAVGLAGDEPLIGPTAYTRIQEGMTREEVKAVVGLPSGNHLTPMGKRIMPGAFDQTWGEKWGVDLTEEHPDMRCWESWIGDRFTLDVSYGEDDKVIGCSLTEFGSPNGWLDRFCWSVKRQWRERLP